MSPFDRLGPALEALRRRAGLSQKEVLDRAEITASAYSRYEAGKSVPRIVTLDAILAALGMDALDLGLELHRQQAVERTGARGAFQREDLLASPVGRQVLDQTRVLYHLGCFWIDAALALLPAARPAGGKSVEPSQPQPEPPSQEEVADAGTR